MGTYTDNYNLFMPSIGEQGWGDLVNGNFSTIDSTMKGLNTRVGTLETEMDERFEVLEAGNFSGNVSGESFNNVIIKKHYTVTYGTNYAITSSFKSVNKTQLLFVLPFNGSTYTGSVQLKNIDSEGVWCYSRLGLTSGVNSHAPQAGKTFTITFTDVDSVYIWGGLGSMSVYEVTLS